MKLVWRFEKTIVDGEEYKSKELKYGILMGRNRRKIKIKDPIYRKFYTFNVFKIQNDNIEILFAAENFQIAFGEFI